MGKRMEKRNRRKLKRLPKKKQIWPAEKEIEKPITNMMAKMKKKIKIAFKKVKNRNNQKKPPKNEGNNRK